VLNVSRPIKSPLGPSFSVVRTDTTSPQSFPLNSPPLLLWEFAVAEARRDDSDRDTTAVVTMPKQYVVFGRPVPRLGTRHISLLLVTISLFAVFSLLFTLPSAIPAGPSLSNPKFSMPKSLKTPPWMTHLNPFKQPAHPPPRQRNDTDGESSWYSHYRWLTTPFSSSVTLDESRSLLPILPTRPPIYCYYDNTLGKDARDKDAESVLLLAWRKAWWAQGFEPIILSSAEGEINPLYDELQRHKEIDPSLRVDLMRWLAWENMGGGLLSHWLLFPMAPYDDALLMSLRRGVNPKLTRWKELDDGLFAGPREEIAATIKLVLRSPHLSKAKSLLAAINLDKAENPFAVDEPTKSLAFYSSRIIQAKYSMIHDEITLAGSRHTGLRNLLQLINSHLKMTWQSLYPTGIAVVKPLPHHTTHMISPAWNLAQNLARCADSPLPKSCPPNRLDCKPCDPGHTISTTTPRQMTNTTGLFTIGTVPHPYTSSTLHAMREQIDIRWVRRESARDAWIADLTKTICKKGVSSGPRLLRFKEAVASDTPTGSHGASLWLLAERDIPDDLDWHFGFSVPTGGGSTPPNHDPADGPVPMPEELSQEPSLLARAQAIVGTGDPSLRRKPKTRATKEEIAVRNAVESWNLADTEAWRFARAFLARKAMERRKWEKKEAKYADGMGSETGRRSPWDRWLE